MTRLEITHKLKQALSKPPKNERDVVYILVEIRKLLELTGNEQKYFWLKFFADWACHTKMDRKTAKELLDRLDSELDVIKGGTLKVGVKRPPTLHTFIIEFNAFLKDVGIYAGLDYNRLIWPVFLKYYARVVRDCPVLPQAKNHNLKHIDEVLLVEYSQPSNPRTLPAGHKFKFGIKWSLRKNGVEIKSYPLEFIYEKPRASN
ncbi:MAG: hypothetical protein HY648_03840 [Acidobacteria bacterium]|nr:hypothetical protein [Acidobacteriota bacterium]